MFAVLITRKVRFFLDEAKIHDIKQLLLPVFERYRANVVFAYLFGSVARGDVSPLSDIDIAIYLAEENHISFFDLKLSLHADVSRALKRTDIDLVVLNTVRNEMLTADIIRNGVVLFDRDTEVREDYEIKRLHESIDFKMHRFAVMGI